MLNSSKIFRLSENQQNFLVHVNPWWDKKLTKLIRKQQGWLQRFGQSVEDYFPQTNYPYEQYSQLIKNVNYFLNFYEAKTKAILKLPKAVSKFQKWYKQVEELKALLTGIVGLTQFYETLAIMTIVDKRQYLIDESNQLLKNMYSNYQNIIKTIAPIETADTFNQIYKNALEQPNQVFNPTLVFNLVHRYLNRLVRLKKISEEVFVNLLFKTVTTAIFFESYVNFQNQLFKSII